MTCSIFAAAARGQNTANTAEVTVQIQVDAGTSDGPVRPVWSFFGYDEPNYTYAENGKKLLGELRGLSAAPVYVRVHNLLTSGDGTASLKWGSTNAYAEDSAGKPVYDWKIVDRIFDTFRERGITPLVEVGFMPEALSTHPQPYKHDFPNGNIFTGWAYPPKDYAKWEELAYQFAKHLRERYGEKEIKNWLWEVWNEPDIDYWKGSQEEFLKLYDFAAQGILRAVPGAKVGGPDTTGAAGAKAAEFLRAFLEHCARGENAATGKQGAPLSFISFHPKGSPVWKGDHVQMRVERELLSVEKGFGVVASFPEWRGTPVILGALKDTLTLSEAAGVNLMGAVTWSFEFEGQPYFEGYRELATNGIDKPVLNAFRMVGMLRGERVKLTSDAAAARETVLHPGEAKIEGVDGLAARGRRDVEVMVWNYREEDTTEPARKVSIEIAGLPASLKRAKLEEFAVDEERSNSFTAWKKMGKPQSPTADERAVLETASRLEKVAARAWVEVHRGKCELDVELPHEGLAFFRLSW